VPSSLLGIGKEHLEPDANAQKRLIFSDNATNDVGKPQFIQAGDRITARRARSALQNLCLTISGALSRRRWAVLYLNITAAASSR
jgi:hypothetical protein